MSGWSQLYDETYAMWQQYEALYRKEQGKRIKLEMMVRAYLDPNNKDIKEAFWRKQFAAILKEVQA
jgi:hypothetical protein